MLQTIRAISGNRVFSMTVTSKGQVTIPAEVRRILRVKQNQKIAIALEPDGAFRIGLPMYPDIASLKGAAGSLAKAITWKQMRKIAHEDRLLKFSAKGHD
jgi:AbrB family looped-hinge helix DNA binding protein